MLVWMEKLLPVDSKLGTKASAIRSFLFSFVSVGVLAGSIVVGGKVSLPKIPS